MKYLPFVVCLLVLGACATPTPSTPMGFVATWRAGDTITLTRGDTKLYISITAMSTDTVSLLGINKQLRIGDQIIRYLDNQWMAFGEIRSIDQKDQSITVLMYAQARVVPQPNWAPTPTWLPTPKS